MRLHLPLSYNVIKNNDSGRDPAEGVDEGALDNIYTWGSGKNRYFGIDVIGIGPISKGKKYEIAFCAEGGEGQEDHLKLTRITEYARDGNNVVDEQFKPNIIQQFLGKKIFRRALRESRSSLQYNITKVPE